MVEVKIIPTTVEHIRMLAATLREDDRRECERLGVTPFKGIWRSYRNAQVCKSGFIGDRIVAIWGISGGFLCFTGNPWVMTSTVVDEYPFVFAMIYRRETREMLKKYRILESWVDAGYAKSLEMMRIIGFKEKERQPMGKHGELFVRLEMTAGG